MMLRLAFNPGLTLTGIPITRPWQANFRTIVSKNWEHTLYISVKRVGGGEGGKGRLQQRRLCKNTRKDANLLQRKL